MTEQPETPKTAEEHATGTDPASGPATPDVGDPAGATDPEPTPSTPDVDDQLGDAGVKALKSERKARADAEKLATESVEKVAALTRRTVAAELGLTPEQTKLLRGDTEEEMTAHANELLEAFTPKQIPRTPVERLKPGSVPGAEPGPGMGEAAEEALRY